MKGRSSSLLYISVLFLSFGFLSYAHGQIRIVGDTFIERHVWPGDVYGGVILLHNEGAAAHTIHLQPQWKGAFSDRSGGQYAEARSNSAWISFSEETLTIEAGQAVRVHYEIEVPHKVNGKTPSGTYWSAYSLVETDAKAARPVFEAAIPASFDLATHIAESGRIDVAISGVDLYEDERNALFLRASMTNTGEAMIRPSTVFEIYDTAGRLLDRIPGQPSRLFPGASDAQYASVDHLEPGQYEVLLLVDAGDEHIFGAQHTVSWTGYGHVAQSGRVDVRQ